MAIYYVDQTGGDDSKDGLAQTISGGAGPWKTIAKVNAASFSAGDSILFKCGETWKAESLVVPSSGTAGNPITFSKYGTGANPIIDPTVEYNDWTLDSGAIWTRTWTGQNIYQVFEDGVRMIFAANKAAMVAGSWSKTGVSTLYVWPSDSGNPTTGHVIEYHNTDGDGAVSMNGKSHLVFDGIDFTKANRAFTFMGFNGQSDIKIRNLEISWCTYGIYTFTGNDAFNNSDVTISNVVCHDVLDCSFWVGRTVDPIVEYCTSYNSGADVAPNGKGYSAVVHFPNGILVSREAVRAKIRYNHIYNQFIYAACMDELSLTYKSSDSLWIGNLIDTSAGSVYGMKIEAIRVTFAYNIIKAGSQSAISFSNNPTTPKIYNNVIISPSGSGHSVETALQDEGIVKNNIFVRDGSSNRFISSAIANGITCDYNLYYQISGTPRWKWDATEYTTFAAWKAASGQDANSLSQDPLFINFAGGDYRLQSTSPAKDAGVDLGLTADYSGYTVPRGVAPDMGAFEVQPISVTGASPVMF